MSYRRFRGRRRFSGGGRRRSFGRRSYGNPGVQALRLVKKIEKAVEVKYLNSVAGTITLPIGGAGQVSGFGPYCVQGDQITNRSGNEIQVKSLAMRFKIALTALETLGTTVRLLVVYDREPGGANATVTTMLNNDNVLSSYRTVGNAKGRFQFLADRTVTFGATDAHWEAKFFKQLNHKIVYNGNAGTVADLFRGNLMVMVLGSGNAAAIGITYGFNIKYTDD